MIFVTRFRKKCLEDVRTGSIFRIVKPVPKDSLTIVRRKLNMSEFMNLQKIFEKRNRFHVDFQKFFKFCIPFCGLEMIFFPFLLTNFGKKSLGFVPTGSIFKIVKQTGSERKSDSAEKVERVTVHDFAKNFRKEEPVETGFMSIFKFFQVLYPFLWSGDDFSFTFVDQF